MASRPRTDLCIAKFRCVRVPGRCIAFNVNRATNEALDCRGQAVLFIGAQQTLETRLKPPFSTFAFVAFNYRLMLSCLVDTFPAKNQPVSHNAVKTRPELSLLGFYKKYVDVRPSNTASNRFFMVYA